MKNVGLSLLIAAFATCVLAETARAEDQKPTVFTLAYEGLLVGAGAGLAAGYLVARDNGWKSSEDWKPLVYGTGIGALVGSGIGLTLGIVDVTQDKPGRTRYVLRDMLYGEGFGATVGVIAGGLTAISTKKPEHILLGASIGVLSGAVLGAVFGFIEGGHAHDHATLDTDNQRFALSIVPVVEAGGKLAYLPALSGRY
jgi:energy-converting hydrogenase Eha subunit A